MKILLLVPPAGQSNSLSGVFSHAYSLGFSGLPMPVNDLMIIHDGVAVPAGTNGEVWIRGPNIMKGYWGDQGSNSHQLW